MKEEGILKKVKINRKAAQFLGRQHLLDMRVGGGVKFPLCEEQWRRQLHAWQRYQHHTALEGNFSVYLLCQRYWVPASVTAGAVELGSSDDDEETQT